jgi:hypothetical protein
MRRSMSVLHKPVITNPSTFSLAGSRLFPTKELSLMAKWHIALYL